MSSSESTPPLATGNAGTGALAEPAAYPDPQHVAGASRRGLMRTAAATSALAVAASVVADPDPAAAANRYRPARYRRTAVPRRAVRHMGNRFAYGITPALNREIGRAGGPRRWFESQLRPSRIPDRRADRLDSWWHSINASPAETYSRHERGVELGWEAAANYSRWALLRRMYSRRQVLEVMAEFWENHLHVPANGEAQFGYRADYGKTIRRHALGRFDQMLHDAITHPAMGIYLDNARSRAAAPNENLGRELLELHTVGVGNYTEADVKDSARILTGWRVDTWQTWEASYDPEWHATGRVRVLGFSDANRAPDGREVTRRYLAYLAHHPRTAERIARKLAVRFVSDQPSQALVDRLARVYLQHDTRIAPVLRALVRSREFTGAVGSKVRTPAEDVLATYRVLGVRVHRPRRGESTANAILWQTKDLGHMPFSWIRPDGQPDSDTAWSSPSRLLASFRVHYSMAGGWWPTIDARHRRYPSWLPQRRIRFHLLVDHLSRLLLGRVSSPALLKACCQATGCRPGELIDRGHPIIRWQLPVLLSTVLDTPAHMSR